MTEETQPELIQVRIIKEKDRSVLIQLADFRRYFVPREKVQDGKIEKTELEKAALYGVPWEAYLGLDSVTTETLALMLRKVGIYTLADLKTRDRQLIRIGTKLIGQVVQDAAKRADKKPPRRTNGS